MNEPQPIRQAIDAVKKILEILQVSRVVCVDDLYDDEPPVEEVVVAACSLDAGRLRELLPELGDSIPDDQDVLKVQIRRLWGELEQTIRSDRAKKILAATGSQNDVEENEVEVDDRKAASILSGLIPDEMLITLSPKQWKGRYDQLLEEDAKHRTLFLFDQDLSKKGGDVDGGMKIIASLLAREDTGNLICGLLTHTVKPENLHEKWVEFSKSYSITSRDRFLIVPKRYLSEDQTLFAQTLKWVALSPNFAELKEKTAKILESAALKAAERVAAISIYDLEHMVFKVSDEEGLWEPDMLFRLHSLFHRLESRQLAYKSGELENIAKRLRSVSHISTETTRRPDSSTWKIQRDELYESDEYLNKNYLPLELGDIFVKTGAERQKHYILLAPPCDLMVRKDGRRHPELVHVPVAEIASASDPPRYAEEIEYFGDDPTKRWFVKLKQVHYVQVCLLDFCVFNDDGKAIMLLGGEAPSAIRPAWKARHTILSKLVGRLLKRLDLLFPVEKESKDVTNLKTKLRSELIDDLLKENLFKGELVNQSGRRGIAYNCCRVGRLSRARAFGLLMAYTSCLSRPAYDRDFV